eukprot:m.235791 g.235791  ORF g.235791 m.235791 type:complete len:196 (+) comp40129_c1_seq8:1380-1967(+)
MTEEAITKVLDGAKTSKYSPDGIQIFLEKFGPKVQRFRNSYTVLCEKGAKFLARNANLDKALASSSCDNLYILFTSTDYQGEDRLHVRNCHLFLTYEERARVNQSENPNDSEFLIVDFDVHPDHAGEGRPRVTLYRNREPLYGDCIVEDHRYSSHVQPLDRKSFYPRTGDSFLRPLTIRCPQQKCPDKKVVWSCS